MTVFNGLLTFTVLQRLLELIKSARNQRRLRKRGFRLDDNRLLMALMIAMHALWFAALIIEPLLIRTRPTKVVKTCALVAFLLAQGLRFWVLHTLGVHWNISVFGPGKGTSRSAELFVARGPYRFIRHPNYLAVIVEFVALPLVGGAYWTLVVFSFLNALLLVWRIRVEESSLLGRPGYREKMWSKPRFLPNLNTLRVSLGRSRRGAHARGI